jgi:hypothetical protein
MKDRLSKAEIRKDALQDGVTAASQAVGSVTTIVTTAIGDVARALGGFATEMFEIRDAARKASRDHLDVVPDGSDTDTDVVEPVEPPEEPVQAPKSI